MLYPAGFKEKYIRRNIRSIPPRVCRFFFRKYCCALHPMTHAPPMSVAAAGYETTTSFFPTTKSHVLFQRHRSHSRSSDSATAPLSPSLVAASASHLVLLLPGSSQQRRTLPTSWSSNRRPSPPKLSAPSLSSGHLKSGATAAAGFLQAGPPPRHFGGKNVWIHLSPPVPPRPDAAISRAAGAIA